MPHKMSVRFDHDATYLIERVKHAVPLTEMIDYLTLRRRGRAKGAGAGGGRSRRNIVQLK